MDIEKLKQQISDAFERERKEKKAEYNKKYWEMHKDQIKEQRKSTQKRRTEWQREWYKKNRDKWNAYLRERNRSRKINKGDNE